MAYLKTVSFNKKRLGIYLTAPFQAISTIVHCHIYQPTMKANPQTKRIAELIESAKQKFGDFSESKKQEIFLTIKEAKIRGLLRKQPSDRCLIDYINVANHLLRSYATDEFTATLNQNLDNIYVYVALVSTNSITI